MNYLVSVVKSLNGKEKIALLRKIKNQQLKLRLFNFIVEKDYMTDNNEISEFFSYKKDSNSLYTLKNRLLDDIMTVKQEFLRNEIIKVQEQIQSLVPLLLMGDNEILFRELKKLEKSAERYDLYNELKTIHHCYYLLSYNNTRKQEKILKHIEELNKKSEVSMEVDRLFFNKLIHGVELFYYPNKKLHDEIVFEREKLNQCCNMLQSQKARFFLQYTDTLLSLVELINYEQRSIAQKNLQNLNKLFEYSSIKKTIPIAQKAIECLYLRFYSLTNNSNQFTLTQRNLYPDIAKLQHHYLFNGCFIVFATHTLYNYIAQAKTEQAIAFISKTVFEEHNSHTPSNYTPHLYYLLALKEYYQNNHDTCSSLLVKARNCSISPPSAWLLLEITLLNIINMLYQNESLYIEHEISLMRRYFLKFKVDETHRKAINSFFRTIKDFNKADGNERVKAAISSVKEETGLLKLAYKL